DVVEVGDEDVVVVALGHLDVRAVLVGPDLWDLGGERVEPVADRGDVLRPESLGPLEHHDMAQRHAGNLPAQRATFGVRHAVTRDPNPSRRCVPDTAWVRVE